MIWVLKRRCLPTEAGQITGPHAAAASGVDHQQPVWCRSLSTSLPSSMFSYSVRVIAAGAGVHGGIEGVFLSRKNLAANIRCE
ncbi:hypothetical protein O9993_07125 [Vibrio lentus]|nr:hypothetical protein [Vibrio lentus]